MRARTLCFVWGSMKRLAYFPGILRGDCMRGRRWKRHDDDRSGYRETCIASRAHTSSTRHHAIKGASREKERERERERQSGSRARFLHLAPPIGYSSSLEFTRAHPTDSPYSALCNIFPRTLRAFWCLPDRRTGGCPVPIGIAWMCALRAGILCKGMM